jgi:type II restriction enzyme
MSRFWNAQKITFIWVTDGKGWLTTKNPLQDYFDRNNILLNIEMLKDDFLEKIVLS